MLDNSSDHMVGVIALMLLAPIFIGLGVWLFEDELISVFTEDQTELVATDESVNEDNAAASDDEYDLSASIDSLVQSGLQVIQDILVAVAIIVCAIVGIGMLWRLGTVIYDTHFFQTIAFVIWMKTHKTPMPLRQYYLFLDKHEHVLPECISTSRAVLRAEIRSNSNQMRYAYIAFMDQDFIDAFGKLTVIVKNKHYLKTFKKHYGEPTKVEMETIYDPIEKAMAAYNNRKSEFHQLSSDTDENELNTLLTQNFTTLKSFRKSK